ncbi:MAG: DUF1801 domain-containing protein [Bacteroidia bacterium]|nr:DUF1801 domain-containing protein [Bacteroidia bacterium]
MLTVDDYFEQLLPWQKNIALKVRAIILSSSPAIHESMKYKVPFYTYKGFLFYLGLYKNKQLILAFCNGYLLSDEQKCLVAHKGQKQIRHWEFFASQSVDWDLLKMYINEAILLNDIISSK